MNLVKKALGIAAGSALALSLASGALAVDGDTTADLFPKTTGACFGSGSSGEIDLGEWEWNGAAYVLRSATTSGSIAFTVTQDVRATPNVNCNLTVNVSNLTNGTPFIPAANVVLSASGGGASGVGPSYTVSTPQGAGQVLTLGASLTGVPTDIPSGTYKGTVTITTPVAAP